MAAHRDKKTFQFLCNAAAGVQGSFLTPYLFIFSHVTARMREFAALLIVFALIPQSCSAVQSTIAVGALYGGGYGVYRQRWQLSGELNVTEPDAIVTRLGYARLPSEFGAYAPDNTSTAVAYNGDANCIYTVKLNATDNRWHVCQWPKGSLERPICAQNGIAPASSGKPTSMLYTGPIDKLLIVAFPESGDVLACSSDPPFTPWARKWAEGLASPASLALDPVSSTVYVALLNADAVRQFDTSGVALDTPQQPFLAVNQPRFVLCNTADASQGAPAFVVLSMETNGAELQLFDRHGNSIGAVTDPVSQWVCDEPGEDENTAADMPRVVSIAYDSTRRVLYATREGSYHRGVDSYDVSSPLPDDAPPTAEQLSSSLVRDAIGLVVESGLARPIGLVDSYQASIRGEPYVTFMACESESASGATVEQPLGLLLCGSLNAAPMILYSASAVYALAMNDDEDYPETPVAVCFLRYLYATEEGSDAIVDAYMANATYLYVLHASGTVARLDLPCEWREGEPATGVTLANRLDVTLIAVPEQDFIVRKGAPCIATRYGIVCAGAAAPTGTGTPVCGSALLDVSVAYSAAHDALLVFGRGADSTAYLEAHVYVNDTHVEEYCALALEEFVGTARFVVDTNSGVVGWIDTASGALYEYNIESGRVESVPSARDASVRQSVPSEATEWVLSDAMGQAVRYPRPAETTKPPKASRKPASGTPTGLIVAGVVTGAIVLALLVGCVWLAVSSLRRRRDGQSSSGKHVHTEGEGSTTYSSEAEVDEASHYWLPPTVRKALRVIFCGFTCCWNSGGRLRCCGWLLGGRAKPAGARAYHQLEVPRPRSSDGDELPSVAGLHHSLESGAEAPEPVAPTPDSDSRMGGAALESVAL